MRWMQKIYKQGIMENRFAIAVSVFASLAITFAVILELFGAAVYWPIGLIADFAFSAALYRTCKPYEINAGVGEVALLIALNLFIFCTCTFVA